MLHTSAMRRSASQGLTWIKGQSFGRVREYSKAPPCSISLDCRSQWGALATNGWPFLNATISTHTKYCTLTHRAREEEKGQTCSTGSDYQAERTSFDEISSFLSRVPPITVEHCTLSCYWCNRGRQEAIDACRCTIPTNEQR